MKHRSQEVCKILNRNHHLGYDNWRINPSDLGACYLSAGKDGVEQFITMYEAFDAAVQLECESGVRFGRDLGD